MLLQKMRYDKKSKKTVVCAMNEIEQGGEYTLCGNVGFESGMGYGDDFEAIGEHFIGKLKDITCSVCIRHIQYVRSFE